MTGPPPLLRLGSETDYRCHFFLSYCRLPIVTHDGIPVRFRETDFEHAFFESSGRDGVKDTFSAVRAQRMDWIGATLLDSSAPRYCGWDSHKGRSDPRRFVANTYADYVVVVRTYQAEGGLRGQFVTAFVADDSIYKIRQSPPWIPP